MLQQSEDAGLGGAFLGAIHTSPRQKLAHILAQTGLDLGRLL